MIGEISTGRPFVQELEQYVASRPTATDKGLQNAAKSGHLLVEESHKSAV